MEYTITEVRDTRSPNMKRQGERPAITVDPRGNTVSELSTTRRLLSHGANDAGEQSAAKETSDKECLLSLAASVASQPLRIHDHSVWGVLTAVSTLARKRPQGVNMLLNSNEHTIGSLVDNPEFKIDSSVASGQHCTIYRKPIQQKDGESRFFFFLKDNSNHGTYLNLKKLTKSSPESLISHGDIISIANGPHSEVGYAFVFREVPYSNSFNDESSQKRNTESSQHLLHLLNAPKDLPNKSNAPQEFLQPSFAVDPAVMEIGPPILFPHQLYQSTRHQVPHGISSTWKMFPTQNLGSTVDRRIESPFQRYPNWNDPVRNSPPTHPPPGFSDTPQATIQPPIVNLQVSSSTIESSLARLALREDVKDNGEAEDMAAALQKEDGDLRKKSKKEIRWDKRGERILPQRMRIVKCRIRCRYNIAMFDFQFLSIYESLIPSKGEQENQRYLLNKLQNLVKSEWSEAKLHLYGSCGNSFGVSNSDIDVCFAMNGADTSDVLTKLAQLLESHNFLDVQAFPRARVPIVKLRDPETKIPCDVCINNMLAVANTKLLRDYSKIDVRLRQLVFIVKHWAKSRDVNETYKGTLSSYAYVLMCINFLQLRSPPILPCLQEMEATYSATVEGTQCSYYDRVEKMESFGSRNKETISQLVWGFFNYWAYWHDYPNDVVSVRCGSLISKGEKEWSRRVGADRHLICIEDPFLVSHDLGRVVDRSSVRVLREEFERAAHILQFDSNPCVTLFAPYVV